MIRDVGRRPRCRRSRPSRARLTTLLAGAALMTAACSAAPATSAGSTAPGSADPVTSAPPGGPSAYQEGVAYAQCMRAHGVPNFPDPLQNGGFALGPGVTGGTGGQVSPAYQAAEKACASLYPPVGLTSQKAERDLSRLLKFAECMRSHGEPKFPDPVYNSSGVYLHIVGLDRNSPQFQDAWRTCTSIVPLEQGTGGGS
jgi:hypothetical protein